MNLNSEKKPTALLFNPFVFIAGVKALSSGLLIILLAGFIGSFSKTHFDGVLDSHSGAQAPLWFFLSEGFADWLCMAAVLLIMGKIISGTSFRVIDVLGTQALARWPTVFISLLAIPAGYQRFGKCLVDHLMKPEAKLEFSAADAGVFLLVLIATITVTCWIVYLMYKSFSVSCNVKGGKAVLAFIAALILAEIISKIGIYSLFKMA